MSFNKVPDHLQHPIDLLFCNISNFITTPNGLTTISIIFSILSVKSFYYHDFASFTFHTWVSYLFDSADGVMARRFNMCTDFGDYYDHVSDISHYISIMTVYIIHVLNGEYHMMKLYQIVFLVVLFILSVLNAYFVELYYNKFHCISSFNWFFRCGKSIFSTIDKNNVERYIKYSRYLSYPTLLCYINYLIYILKID